MSADRRVRLFRAANPTIMSFHADVSTAAHKRTRINAHCAQTHANLPLFAFSTQRNKLPLSSVCMWVCFFLSSFVLLRFRFSLSFETPMLSQTGVCLCTVLLGFAGCVCLVCVSVCVLKHTFLNWWGVHGSFMCMSVFAQVDCCSVVY